MGSQIITRPLARPLEEGGRKGILRSNSPEKPFWVPEENPVLRLWDMTLEEYCRTVRRVTGLDLRTECGAAFCTTWPELIQADWNIGLVAILGHGYRLTHPDRGEEPPQEGGPEDELRYVPASNPYNVWVRWEDSSVRTIGEARDREALDRSLAELVLSPFHAMEVKKREKKAPENREKGR